MIRGKVNPLLRVILGKATAIAKGYGLEEAFGLFYSAKKSEGMRERTLGSYKSHWRYFRE
ncbi:hypothetical protein A8708_34485 [Paenibacillus oryzisoli]|uniref:Uncharacterized protein n=1 Tax=Paenibacillus oryzisoli TaxID=1850517 RepID=A0A198A0I1_9BACL|nr:hypothetical protein A8708_34485 [Paenibacillus oryzisoli]